VSVAFHNTIDEAGAELARSIATAKGQDAAVLAIFARTDRPLSPSQVWLDGWKAGNGWLLTSVRRSMSNLTERGLLVRNDELVPGRFGKREHTWSRAA